MATDDAKPKAPQAPSNPTPPRLRGLLSRLNHSTTVSYGDDVIVVPPRGKVPNVDSAKLGSLPKGVTLTESVED